jgi:hypothetical protein
MLACLLMTGAAFTVAFHVDYAISQVFIGLAMAGGALTMLLALLRAQMCRCPQCKSWLFRQLKVDTDTEPRLFVCNRCSITWNSQVILTFGGD